jgi:hypothetical protein
MAVEVTGSHVHDSQMLPSLLTQIPGQGCQVSGDGAYDTKACYKSIDQRGAKATIPPRRNAKRLRCDNSLKKLAIRDVHLRQIQQDGTTELGGECYVSVQVYLWFQAQGAAV